MPSPHRLGELGAGVELDASRGYRDLPGPGHDGDGRGGPAAEIGQEGPTQPGVVFAEHLVEHRHQRFDIVPAGDRA